MKILIFFIPFLLLQTTFQSSRLFDFYSKFQKATVEDPIFPDKGISGYVGITDEPTKNKMFYWYWKARKNPDTAPLVIWLTGGPGCSSELAVAFENGPFTIQKDGSLLNNTYSWNTNANLLFIDHPIGTGYSEGETKYLARNATMIREYFYSFFVKWLDLSDFKKYKGKPLYLVGESYAGHYIPQISNKLFLSGNTDINLVGVAIGNGWTWPSVQQTSYIPYSIANSQLTKFTADEGAKLIGKALLCQQMMDYYNPLVAKNYETVCNEANGPTQMDPDGKARFNPYDIRLKCVVPGLCYDFSFIKTFFNRTDVKTELGVSPDLEYSLCSDRVDMALAKEDVNVDCAPFLTPLLEFRSTKVLFYNGVMDWICNWMGTESFLSQMPWNGVNEWNKQPYTDSVYGKSKSYKNLRFIRFDGAGHMVPHDQPKLALQMLNEFIGIEE